MADHNITLDASTKLAYDRTRLAYERTLMAWVRTGTSLITFGFTIYKFFEEFQKAGQVPRTGGPVGAREFGIIMISIGLVAVLLANRPACHSNAQAKSAGPRSSLFIGCRDRSSGLSARDYSVGRDILSTIDLPKMAEANRADSEIFDGGPPLRLEKSLGLVKPNERRSVQRALLVVLIVWAPLFVLSAIESLVLKENKLGSLIGDLTVLSRYLIVVPLFILAEDRYDFSARADNPPFYRCRNYNRCGPSAIR